MLPRSERIILIGSGSVATTLGLALYNSGHHIIEVVSRNRKHAELLGRQVNAAKTHTDFAGISPYATLYIIAVSDDAVEEVVQKMPAVDGLVVHTSGTVSSKVISSKYDRWGVFYPLQTFTPGRLLDFNKIPFLITCTGKKVEASLTDIAASVGSTTHHMDDEGRRHLHVAAVMVNNFTNHLLALSEEYLKKQKLPPQILHALAIETVAKAVSIGAGHSQTGPAQRGDQGTIDRHVEMLEKYGNPTLTQLYILLSKSIMEFHDAHR